MTLSNKALEPTADGAHIMTITDNITSPDSVTGRCAAVAQLGRQATMSIPGHFSSYPSRTVAMPRGVTATVFRADDHDEVSFIGRSQSRDILVRALQEKPDFIALVRRFGIRIVPCIDGQLYFLSAASTEDFISEVGRLVTDFIPEIPD